MRNGWGASIQDTHLNGAGWWALSDSLERFLNHAVNEEAFRQELVRWRADSSYCDSAWNRPTYAHWYLGFYVPIYVTSLQRTLFALNPFTQGESLRVLDIGVGAGTTALAVLDILVSADKLRLGPLPRIEMTCIDRDARKLAISSRNVEGFRRQAANDGHANASNAAVFHWEHLDIADVAHSEIASCPFDLVVLGNVVSEVKQRFPRTRDLMPGLVRDLVKPTGHVVCVLPGLASQRGLEAREVLCELRRQLSCIGFEGFKPCGSRGTHADCEQRCAQRHNMVWPRYYVDWSDGDARNPSIRTLGFAARRSLDSVEPTIEDDIPF